MRIKIDLISPMPVILPVGYYEYMQALIYNHLNIDAAKWLHENGFAFEKRKFKLFSFSSIMEKGIYERNNKIFKFPQNISFLISSPVDWILEQLANNFIQSNNVQLGSNSLQVNSIEIIKTKTVEKNSIKVKAITPIEVHSTFEKSDGKKLTHFYSPYEDEFKRLINENLKKKWKAFYREECQFDIDISPQFKGNQNEKFVYFGTKEKKTFIKGWKGFYILKGKPEMLQFALDAGLGSRNSQGFGMIEVIE